MSQLRSPEISLHRPGPADLPLAAPPVRSAPAAMPRPVLPLLFIAVLLVLNGLLWIHLIPAGRAPAEVNHLWLIDFIAHQHRLPVLDLDARLDNQALLPDKYLTHPPGGYLLSAAVAACLPATTSDSAYVADRLGSLLCLLLCLPLLAATVRLIFPASRAMQIGVPLLCLLIPQVTFIGAYANPDAFGLLCGACFAYALCGGICRGWSVWRTIIFGLAVGLMLLGPFNGYAMIPVFGLGLVLTAKPTGHGSLRGRLFGLAWRSALVMLVASVVAGWWFWFNVQTYREWIPVQTLANAQAAIHGGPYHTLSDDGLNYCTLLSHTGWLSSMFCSSIGVFDYMSLPLPTPFFKIAAAIVGIALIGLIIGTLLSAGWAMAGRIVPRSAGQAEPAPPPLFPDAHPRLPLLLALFVAALVAVAFQVLHLALRRDYQAQGRCLFPALPGAVILIIVGLRLPLALLPAKIAARSGGIAAMVLATLLAAANIYASAFVLAPHYDVPELSLMPLLSIVPATPFVHIVDQKIGDTTLPGLFVHGGNALAITLVPAAAHLRLRIGIDPQVENQCAGVRFRISVDDGHGRQVVLDRTVCPKDNPTDRDFPAATANFSPYVGRAVTVIWSVQPVATTAYNWAVFLDPNWAN